MTSLELLKEIDAWLSFNTEPSREETAKLRKSIKDHLTEQLRIHDVVRQSEQLPTDEDCVNAIKRQLNENGFKTN